MIFSKNDHTDEQLGEIRDERAREGKIEVRRVWMTPYLWIRGQKTKQ